MKMLGRIAPLLAALTALALAISCGTQPSQPTPPQAVTAGGPEGTMRAMPDNVPWPPPPSGGGGGGVVPVPWPPSQPTPTPAPSSAPSPAPGPTPTPNPSPVACPASLVLNAAGTPKLLSAATGDWALFGTPLGDYGTDCLVDRLRLSMHVTTAAGFGSAPSTDTPRAQLGICGTGQGWSGCGADHLYSFSGVDAVATGNQLGSSCGDFVFDTGSGTAWDNNAPPAPPYAGTYRFAADSLILDNTRLRNLDLTFLYVFDHPEDAVLECARIEIWTRIARSPAP